MAYNMQECRKAMPGKKKAEVREGKRSRSAVRAGSVARTCV